VNQQRSLLQQTPPKFIVETNMLIHMVGYIHQLMASVIKPHQQQQQQQIPSGPLGQVGQPEQAQQPQLQQSQLVPGQPQVPSGSSLQIQAQQQHTTTAPGGVDTLHHSLAGLSL
jgi:hypothetical protein